MTHFLSFCVRNVAKSLNPSHNAVTSLMDNPQRTKIIFFIISGERDEQRSHIKNSFRTNTKTIFWKSPIMRAGNRCQQPISSSILIEGWILVRHFITMFSDWVVTEHTLRSSFLYCLLSTKAFFVTFHLLLYNDEHHRIPKWFTTFVLKAYLSLLILFVIGMIFYCWHDVTQSSCHDFFNDVVSIGIQKETIINFKMFW